MPENLSGQYRIPFGTVSGKHGSLYVSLGRTITIRLFNTLHSRVVVVLPVLVRRPKRKFKNAFKEDPFVFFKGEEDPSWITVRLVKLFQSFLVCYVICIDCECLY